MKKVHLIDVATQKQIWFSVDDGGKVGHTNWVTGLAWTSCGRSLVSCSVDKTARFWNLSSSAAKTVELPDSSSPAIALEFSVDGKSLNVKQENGEVKSLTM